MLGAVVLQELIPLHLEVDELKTQPLIFGIESRIVLDVKVFGLLGNFFGEKRDALA
jgi:hypothetical protein